MVDMSPPTQDDSLRIGQIAAGDREAFEKLYFAYQRRLFGFLYRALGESGAAEELVNDVMVEVWKSAARFRGDSKPSTWIFGIAHHLLLNHVRRRKAASVDLEKAEQTPDRSESPEGAAINEHREVVELCRWP